MGVTQSLSNPHPPFGCIFARARLRSPKACLALISMKIPVTGGCVCGEVRYESSAEPLLMLKCHCRDCQRITGGAYVPAVVFPLSAFRVTRGAIKHFATEGADGGHNLRSFCATCGSRLTGAENQQRGIIAVVASSLDDPSIFVPKFDMFVADAQPWDVMDPATKKFPQHFSR